MQTNKCQSLLSKKLQDNCIKSNKESKNQHKAEEANGNKI